MSYTFLLAQGEESSAESFSDIPQSVLSKLNLTAEKSYSNDNAMESCRSSRYGMIYGHSTECRGAERPILSVGDSRAKILVQQERALELAGCEVDYGQKWLESLAKYDPDSFSWKTVHCLFQEVSIEFSEICPQWGLMLDSELLALRTPELFIRGKGFGYWPTPSGTSNHGKNHVCGRLDEWGGSGNRFRGTNLAKVRCPDFEEWMMGWPITWTELIPFEMDRFQQWLHSHGASFRGNNND